jgi:hypothetical protein
VYSNSGELSIATTSDASCWSSIPVTFPARSGCATDNKGISIAELS